MTKGAIIEAREALEFYAAHNNWRKDLETGQCEITNDQGMKATEALKRLDDEVINAVPSELVRCELGNREAGSLCKKILNDALKEGE